MPDFRIAPSLLSADFARLGDEVRAVIAAGADLIHFDVMDNHYVPNLTIGPLVCEALKTHATVPIDVHLMVKPVDRIVPDFAKAGAAIISFHPEASDHVDRTIGLIHDCGCKAGLVFNPATPLDWLDHTLDKLDLVLDHVGQPRLRRSVVHSARAREAARACARAIDGDPAEDGPRDHARGRRRRQGRQHRGDRQGRRRHVRRRLGDLRHAGLRGDDRHDARGARRACRKTGSLTAPDADGIVIPLAWSQGRVNALPGNALNFDLFDRNTAVVAARRWCATDWRRSAN